MVKLYITEAPKEITDCPSYNQWTCSCLAFGIRRSCKCLKAVNDGKDLYYKFFFDKCPFYKVL